RKAGSEVIARFLGCSREVELLPELVAGVGQVLAACADDRDRAGRTDATDVLARYADGEVEIAVVVEIALGERRAEVIEVLRGAVSEVVLREGLADEGAVARVIHRLNDAGA